jgi:hypothetical protein
MPVPERQKGEPQDKFLSDCIAELVSAGHENDQAAAICYQQMGVQLTTSNEFDQFADTRLQGAEKITNDSKEKGGLALLTYYHYNAKLSTYEDAANGKFDLEKAKQEFKNLYSSLSYDMEQIEFQKVMGRLEVLGELIIEDNSVAPQSDINLGLNREWRKSFTQSADTKLKQLYKKSL